MATRSEDDSRKGAVMKHQQTQVSPATLQRLRGDWGSNGWVWEKTEKHIIEMRKHYIAVPEDVYEDLIEIGQAENLDFDAGDLVVDDGQVLFRNVRVKPAPIEDIRFYEPAVSVFDKIPAAATKTIIIDSEKAAKEDPEIRTKPKKKKGMRSLKHIPRDQLTPEQQDELDKRRARMQKAAATRAENLRKQKASQEKEEDVNDGA